tara:strand:- start:107 stop:478 length:372 start_codon:yes stop_codon:yes gene_type:complete
MIEDMQNRVNADTSLVHRGRWVNLTFVLGIDEDDYLITIAAGKVTDIRPRQLPTDTGKFSIRASAKSWAKHWQKVPPRDYHDIFAMLPKKIVKIDGTLEPFMQNLQYFKDIIATLRCREGERK